MLQAKRNLPKWNGMEGGSDRCALTARHWRQVPLATPIAHRETVTKAEMFNF